MRRTLLSLTALAGLIGLGAIGNASAHPVGLETVPASELVQPVQYYGEHREWRRHEWQRHRRWVEYRRHHGYDRRW